MSTSEPTKESTEKVIANAKRVCQIIKLKPSYESSYIQIHANPWPGLDYEDDMKKIAEDPDTQRWWKVTDEMQESLVEGAEGSGTDLPWWKDLPEVFRFDGQVRGL
ncbi:hypothetical protein CPB84DRAFT_1780691 [Gymnopilus junonius]|uniref:Uncharacterized protein n=1 Tax=Gymnopilus junonius TaxID=109634 RepID=A0A9P5NJK7_GYMJU|nr:hypothetical protein CPB84DRAFT_1780691 [Gymnopilus junonius]